MQCFFFLLGKGECYVMTQNGSFKGEYKILNYMYMYVGKKVAIKSLFSSFNFQYNSYFYGHENPISLNLS